MDIIPNSHAELALFAKNLAIKMAVHAVRFHFSPADIQAANDDAESIHWLNLYVTQVDTHKKNAVAHRQEMLEGIREGGVPFPFQAGVVPTEMPTNLVSNGIIMRLRDRIRIIKSYKPTHAELQDFGLVAPQQALDLNTQKPTFTIRLVGGGHPEILWKKGKMHGVDIYACYDGSGRFEHLSYDQYPNYTDMHPLPEAGQSVVWQYRLIYRYKDQQVGEYSDVVSVMVRGY